jgi:hypothetical protein
MEILQTAYFVFLLETVQAALTGAEALTFTTGSWLDSATLRTSRSHLLSDLDVEQTLANVVALPRDRRRTSDTSYLLQMLKLKLCDRP